MSSESAGLDQSSAAAARRSRLIGIKLRALVRDHLADDTVAEPVAFAPGAALLHEGAAWIYLDEQPARRLGAALAWAVRAGATGLNLIAEEGTGVLARRAPEFALPIAVWHADERALLPAVAEPLLPPAQPPASHAAFRALIVAGGAEPVVEHGVLAGEVEGLEVCRVVDDEFTGEPRLEVGTGAHDREAFAMIHGDVPTVDSLTRIVSAVAERRRLDAPPHPLNRLARERLLRAAVIASPELAGATELAPMAPPVPRQNLKDAVPCVAAGRAADGTSLVVVCSVGVDLDLVPFAADARLAAEAAEPGVRGEGSRLVVITPRRDLVRVTEELVGLMRRRCELRTLD